MANVELDGRQSDRLLHSRKVTLWVKIRRDGQRRPCPLCPPKAAATIADRGGS